MHVMLAFFLCFILDTKHEDPAIPMLRTEMALLDQSLCHVLVDKALQSAVLLLEHTETRRECAKLLNNNNSLTKELEVMRLQVINIYDY